MSTEYPPLINEIVQKLDTRQPLPPLAPEKEWDSELTKQIQAASIADLFNGRALKDPSLANAVKSALLLWNDALDDSHDISQGVRSKTGSYWHGIMHRREPDYSNSKYWFARVGSHPIFPALRARVLEILKADSSQSEQLARYAEAIERNDNWDAPQFIDWCQDAAKHADDEVVQFLQTVQVEEMKLLLDYSCRNALA
ncbi:MAG: hypothetical protein OXN17_02465 [Candidatus Poribacteria bacterium]|nr:hypothetical protein [Candidatus Poribacteria bacterium]MDE0503316.1 hypothetical protein [Candidatus Poribacteria bacterium]